MLFLGTASAHDAALSVKCAGDLDDARAFLTVNDAGASAALADHGAAIARAYETAHDAAASARDDDTCFTILSTYLHAWRAGHLAVGRLTQAPAFSAAIPPPAQGAADPRAPQLQVLSKDTLLMTLPTFGVFYGATMQRFIAARRAVLEAHRNWIVDVRRNDGGSDSTYAPLLPWLLDGELRADAAEYFVTPANIKAQEDICAMTDFAGCEAMQAPIVARMRLAAPGSFVLQGDRVIAERVDAEPHRPARVALLIDQPCGSSCEQFVLAARTGMRVKVLGRPTGGMLDVSNLRPHVLPSSRMLWYATTRSTRLPLMRIDDIGIAPDILLPKPADDAARDAEVEQVQRWLEGGSLANKDGSKDGDK
jgi:hypothetical protein